jgi:hypothetical protein
MIGELVKYPAPKGWDREKVVEDAWSVVPKWQAQEQLVRKHFMWSEDGEWLSGFYLWHSRKAAEAAHNDDWKAAVKERTGKLPEISYFDAFLILDNESGEANLV